MNDVSEKIKINGLIFNHGSNDYSLWKDFNLLEADEMAILMILSKYETDGYSIRGTKKQIAKDFEA